MIETGFTDTADSTSLWVPGLRLIVAYLRSFTAAADNSSTARELYDRMLGLYPRRANPGALWGGTKAAKPA